MNNPWLDQTIADAVRWPKRMSMLEWCEANVVIPRRAGTAHPGLFRAKPYSPWMEGWMNLMEDPAISNLNIMKGAQVSATQSAYNATMYWLANDPDPMMILMPTHDIAIASSKLRIIPMMEETKAVRDTFTNNKYDIKLDEYTTKNTYVKLFGANSAAKLATFSYRRGILDEPDKYPKEVGNEGSAVGLAEQRATTFDNSFLMAMSTPTTKAGYIYRMFKRGDQRYYFVPCPHCGHFQVLKWKQVRFNSKLDPVSASKTAYYECENKKCHAKLDDADKWEMCQRGEWQPTEKTKMEGTASCHLSGIYSMSRKRSFGFLVQKFLERKDNKADLQDFINSDLGELWEDTPKKSISREKIYQIRDRNKYARGTIPTTEKFFLLTVVDVQQSHIVYGIWALGHSDAWLIDHGYTSVLEDIPEKSAGPFFDATGNEHVCTRELYDTGYRTTEVYKWLLKSPRTRLAIKGEKGRITSSTAPVRPQKLGSMPSGKPLPYGAALILHHIHPSYFKDELAEALNPQEVIGSDGESQAVPMDELDFRIHFHEDIDGDFVDQIIGEVLVSDDPDKFGVEKQYWKKIGKNDFFDVSQYMMAARYMAKNELQALKRSDVVADEDESKEDDRQQPPSGVSYAGELDGEDW